MKELDLRNLSCPAPVIEARKALLAEPAASFRVLLGDDMALENVGRLARTLGYRVSPQEVEQGFGLQLDPAAAAKVQEAAPAGGASVVFVTSEVLGRGDDELGRILLRNFLITLVEAKETPDRILFVNAGVKLACEGSEALEALEALSGKGVDIASCGLCLDFYHLKDKLRVGRVTNMLDIVENLQRAAQVIRP